MSAVSTVKLSPDRKVRGKYHLRSEQAVVLHSTATDKHSCGELPLTKETVTILTAFTLSLLSEVLSEDVISLAMGNAERMVKASGVSQKEYTRVMATLMLFWSRKKEQNPIGSMF